MYTDETEEHEHATRPEPKVWIVAVYLIDRAYGGPEEGGWYYTCGERVRVMRTFKREERADAYAARLGDKLDATLNKGRRSISSVLSTGRYAAEVHPESAPAYFPESRPYYE